MNWTTRYRTSKRVTASSFRSISLWAIVLAVSVLSVKAQVVIDNAEVFSAQKKEQLTQQANNFFNTYRSQIFIYTVDGTEGSSLKSFAEASNLYKDLKLYDVMVIISKSDQDAYIATSKEKPDWLKPKLRRRLRNKELRPILQRGDYYAAATKSIVLISGLASGKVRASEYNLVSENTWHIVIKYILTPVLLITIFAIMYFVASGTNRNIAGTTYKSNYRTIKPTGNNNFTGNGITGSW